MSDMQTKPKQKMTTEKEKITRKRIFTHGNCKMGASRYLKWQLKQWCDKQGQQIVAQDQELAKHKQSITHNHKTTGEIGTESSYKMSTPANNFMSSKPKIINNNH